MMMTRSESYCRPKEKKARTSGSLTQRMLDLTPEEETGLDFPLTDNIKTVLDSLTPQEGAFSSIKPKIGRYRLKDYMPRDQEFLKTTSFDEVLSATSKPLTTTVNK